MAEIKKTLHVGTLLHGEKFIYEVEDVLGAGSFGITYKAKTRVTIDNVTHTVRYAVKEFFVSAACLRADDGSVVVNTAQKELYATQLAAFKREAEMLRDMPKHKGIVSVTELIDAFNTSYYVMEYLGESLEHHVESSPGRMLPEQKAVEIFLKLSEAVAFLHSQRRLHLDIKPNNVMFYDGHPKLIDFGQSKLFDGHETDKQGEAVSSGYSPVEQYSGITSFAPSADIYALGATLLYMLTGRQPVDAKDMSAQYIDSVLPEGISAETRQVLHKCLDRDPRQRGGRISDILSILGYIISDDNATTPIGKESKPRSHNVRRSGIMLKALISVLVVAVIGFVVWLFLTPAPVKERPAKAPVPVDSVPTPEQPEAETQKEPDQPVAPVTSETSTQSPVEKSAAPVEKPAAPVEKHVAPVEKPSLDYASWTGHVKNGKPDGYGTMTFTRSHVIPGTARQAGAGDVLKGTFSNGRLVNGELNGEYIEIED